MTSRQGFESPATIKFSIRKNKELMKQSSMSSNFRIPDVQTPREAPRIIVKPV